MGLPGQELQVLALQVSLLELNLSGEITLLLLSKLVLLILILDLMEGEMGVQLLGQERVPEEEPVLGVVVEEEVDRLEFAQELVVERS